MEMAAADSSSSMLDAASIIGYFKGKSILVTGSTGFLGKILVEKVLRVQPDVHKMYLLVRAIDAASADHRVQQEVIGTELFGLLREKHGEGFELFIREKVVALAGDITEEGLGLLHQPPTLHELAKEMDVIVNIAATTNFYERYDVSLGVNALGVKHICQFAQQCANLKMLMHVSTAYVSGDSTEPILEKPMAPGQALRGEGEGLQLDVDAELRLVSDAKKSLLAAASGGGDDDASAAAERKAMKELGLQRARHFGWSNTYVFTKAMGEMVLEQQRRELQLEELPVVVVRPSIITSVRADPLPGWTQGTRTVDTLIIGYAKQRISCFLADLRVVMDVVPGDMVVNAMLAAVVAHALLLQGPAAAGRGDADVDTLLPAHVVAAQPGDLRRALPLRKRHFRDHPRRRPNGEVIPNKDMRFFPTIPRFRLYMILSFKLPLEMLHMANLLLCGVFSKLYSDSNRKYKFVMHLVDVYGPFAFFKGRFDDANLERLRSTMVMNKTPEDEMFNFDPKSIDWDDYFYRIHIPGVLKYVCK